MSGNTHEISTQQANVRLLGTQIFRESRIISNQSSKIPVTLNVSCVTSFVSVHVKMCFPVLSPERPRSSDHTVLMTASELGQGLFREVPSATEVREGLGLCQHRQGEAESGWYPGQDAGRCGSCPEGARNCTVSAERHGRGQDRGKERTVRRPGLSEASGVARVSAHSFHGQ